MATPGRVISAFKSASGAHHLAPGCGRGKPFTRVRCDHAWDEESPDNDYWCGVCAKRGKREWAAHWAEVK